MKTSQKTCLQKCSKKIDKKKTHKNTRWSNNHWLDSQKLYWEIEMLIIINGDDVFLNFVVSFNTNFENNKTKCNYWHVECVRRNVWVLSAGISAVQPFDEWLTNWARMLSVCWPLRENPCPSEILGTLIIKIERLIVLNTTVWHDWSFSTW